MEPTVYRLRVSVSGEDPEKRATASQLLHSDFIVADVSRWGDT